jgi:predicted GIY-YIG superfamily endonuclease
MKYFAYILEGARGRWYYGSSADPIKRLAQHNAGLVKSTAYGRPWKILHMEELPNAQLARQREKYFKLSKNKKYLRKLVGIS